MAHGISVVLIRFYGSRRTESAATEVALRHTALARGDSQAHTAAQLLWSQKGHASACGVTGSESFDACPAARRRCAPSGAAPRCGWATSRACAPARSAGRGEGWGGGALPACPLGPLGRLHCNLPHQCLPALSESLSATRLIMPCLSCRVAWPSMSTWRPLRCWRRARWWTTCECASCKFVAAWGGENQDRFTHVCCAAAAVQA